MLRGRRKEADDERSVAQRIRDLSPGTWVGRMTGAARKESS